MARWGSMVVKLEGLEGCDGGSKRGLTGSCLGLLEETGEE